MCATVSIIVPVYNAESSIGRCIQSIQAQTYKDWKLLLIDDGSTDKSAEVCLDFLSDLRIKLYQRQNGGVSSARNFAMDHLDTPYFVCVDSDDSIEPEYLSELLKARELYPQAGHIWCCFQTVNLQDEINPQIFLANNTEKISVFDRSEVMSLYELWLLQMPWHKLYDTNLIQDKHIRMDESVSLGEDLLFNLEYMDSCNKTSIIVINLPLYNYVRVEGQSLDHKYRNDLPEIYQKSNCAMQYYLDKWGVSQEQKQIFYNVRFYKMERMLRNTFHPDNKMSFIQKIRINDQVMESQEFQDALEMRQCYVHPMILWGYKRKKYLIVLIMGTLSRIKHRLIRSRKKR